MHLERVLTKPFVLAVLAEFAVCMSIGMLLVILPVYATDELGAGSFGVALTIAAVSPMLLVFQPIAGRIGDRSGRRVLIVAGSLIAAASVGAYALVDSLELLIALRLVTGIGEAMLLVGAATMVTDLAPERRRGEALSLYSLGLWGGLALGPLLGELVLGAGRFDAVWLLAASCCLAGAAIGLTLPETAPPRSIETAAARLVHPAAVGPGLVLAVTVFGFAGLGTFAALYARELGLDGAGEVFLVFSAVVVATRVLARQVPDRLGPKPTSGAALALIAAGLLTVGVWNAPEGLFVGTVVLAFGQALAFPALMTLAVNGAPASERSSVVGTFTAFTELGFAVGALSLGAIASAVGYDGGLRRVCIRAAPGDARARTNRGLAATERRRSRVVETCELGRSGIAVTRIVLGCGNFGGVGSSPAFFGQGIPRGEAFRIMDAAWDLGLTTFDTADAYGGGRSETWIGEWLVTKGQAVQDAITIETKTYNPMDEGHDHGLAPARIRRQLDSSLRRLGVERVLYLAHEFDPDTPHEETLSAFDELVRAGRIAAVGASNFTAEQLVEAVEISQLEGLVRYEWVQNSFSLLDRDDADTVFPLCHELGLGYEAFGPLAGGWLTGKYRRGTPYPEGSRMTQRPQTYLRYANDGVFDALESLELEALDRGVSMAGLAIAWLLGVPEVTAVVVGPTRAEHLEPVREALSLELTAAERVHLTGLFA